MQPTFTLDYSLACLKDKDYALRLYNATGVGSLSVYIQAPDISALKTFFAEQDFPLPPQGVQQMFRETEPDIILNPEAQPVYWRKDFFNKELGVRFNHQLTHSFSMQDFISADITDIHRNFTIDELVTQRKSEREQLQLTSNSSTDEDDMLSLNTPIGSNWYISL